jgi:hypothetical protein
VKGLGVGLLLVTAVILIGLFTFAVLGIWFSDDRWGGLAMMSLLAAIITGGVGGLILTFSGDPK